LLKLIIVDDESTTRRGLSEWISSGNFGIEVAGEAEDGIMGLELALEKKPDIILSDIRMPRMNGIEFTCAVREKLPDVKIIFLSGYSDKEYLKAAIKIQAVDYVEKPIDLEEIKKVIRNTVTICMKERKKAGSMDWKSPDGSEINSTVRQVMSFIDEHYNEDLSINYIADSVYLTPTYLCMLFKKQTKRTINDYIEEVRMKKAKLFLVNKRIKLYEISNFVGYKDPNYFTKVFKKLTGISPSGFRENNLR